MRFACPHCEYRAVFESHLESHICEHKATVSTRPFECELCCKTFTLKKSLVRHTRIHTRETPFHCTKCGRGFQRSDYRRCHEVKCAPGPEESESEGDEEEEEEELDMEQCRNENGALQCPQPQCEYVTPFPSRFVTHARVHSGERPFKCPYCTAAFKQKGNLKQHIRTHTGEKPYECTNCRKRFAWGGTFRRHQEQCEL